MDEEEEGRPTLCLSLKTERSPSPTAGKEHPGERGGAHLQDSLSRSLFSLSLLPQRGGSSCAGVGTPSEVTPKSSGALEAQKWKQTAFAQTLLQQELLTTGLAELGGLAWERGVGLISIATRKRPRRALALPPDGGARKGRY